MREIKTEQTMNPKTIETTTVWSFPKRDKHLTHNSKYPGNWAPQIPWNIMMLYSKEGDTVLDPMVGSGTTMIEAKSLKRKGIGFDIHQEVVRLAREACKFEPEKGQHEPNVSVGDARDLSTLKDQSIDLVLTHPPYLNIIKYGVKDVEGDLSRLGSLPKFCDEIEKVARESFRVLKPGKYCAILMGDTRRRKHMVPLAVSVMKRFLIVGFILKEDIIKLQHNCSTTRYWNSQAKDFLLIMHEHLFVFRKPNKDEDVSIFRDSMLKQGGE